MNLQQITNAITLLIDTHSTILSIKEVKSNTVKEGKEERQEATIKVSARNYGTNKDEEFLLTVKKI